MTSVAIAIAVGFLSGRNRTPAAATPLTVLRIASGPHGEVRNGNSCSMKSARSSIPRKTNRFCVLSMAGTAGHAPDDGAVEESDGASSTPPPVQRGEGPSLWRVLVADLSPASAEVRGRSKRPWTDSLAALHVRRCSAVRWIGRRSDEACVIASRAVHARERRVCPARALDRRETGSIRRRRSRPAADACSRRSPRWMAPTR